MVGAEMFSDEAVVQGLEGAYKTEDAARRRRVVLEALALEPGERVIDIGTGPGFVALEMAGVVGPTGAVLAIDTAEGMLALAARRLADRPWVVVQTGDATKLPAEDATFDAAVSVQVYEFIADVAVPVGEMARVLCPGGRGVIMSTDWTSIAWNAADEARRDRILAAFTEHCPHQDLPRRLAPVIRAAGLELTGQRVFPMFNLDFDANRHSYHLAPLIAGFARGRQGVTDDDATGWLEDLRTLAGEGRYFFELNQYLFSVRRPAQLRRRR
ncbi:MAG: methyltransferase domain-containing protein [Acidimicrobiia bacterium]